MVDATTATTTLDASHVYVGVEVVGRELYDEYDYSVIRVDRPIIAPGAQILEVRRTGAIPVGTRVGVIGHPSGLPTKIAFGENTLVRNGSADGYFIANLDEFDHVELYEATAEMALPQLDIKPQVILVDPPRAGIHRRALDGILKLAPALLVYISCDPATLARDAKRLINGDYHLAQITPFDLFPQTYHIETISFWQKT